MLRAIQAGLKLSDLDYLEYGEVADIIIEAANDNAHYDRLATQDDIDNLF